MAVRIFMPISDDVDMVSGICVWATQIDTNPAWKELLAAGNEIYN